MRGCSPQLSRDRIDGPPASDPFSLPVVADGASNLEELRVQFQGVMLRRTKDEVLYLPPTPAAKRRASLDRFQNIDRNTAIQ